MINGISQLLPANGLNQVATVGKATQQTDGASFSDYLNSALEQVNNDQIASDKMTESLATGQAPDLHTVMITTEKAQLSFELAVQIRNKALESYQEIMRMQM
ncbi:MAG: flagellar hook-basal body complex protein FliE [Tumebacillaceae bacterium]